ncbi:SusC/RagA family TonB-linked outer membrane protein [Mucilaginibacter sp. UYCu711]|uniref:SusC/RagA family TonB-linked outer membrane protein n=1 Tax=Mucilaginibacter sp. UYCu711 TaxID=3156339 RepID=UPI003D1CC777
MKMTLLNKIPIKRSRLLGSIILLFVSSLTLANTLLPVSHKRGSTHTKNVAEITIKGNVTDASNGQTLIGVTIKVKGSQAGAVTDINGNYSIKADENASLVFTYVGYDPIEISVSSKTSLDVKMQPSSKNLGEVVVVGYGTQKKTSMTASVATLKMSEITQKPVVNLTNSLAGRVSGIIATQGSGEPGFDGSSFSIRGSGSIGGSAVLLIVDGVPRDFSRLDPNTIASLTVLKDAAAVAPYGVAGANGVVLVTTKQGTIGKPSLSYSGYTGIQNPTKVPTFVTGYQYALMKNEANVNDFQVAIPYSATDLQKFQDHSDPDVHGDSHPLQEIIKHNRVITSHNLSLSGGSENFKYFASLGYTHQAGMWDPTYLDKYNGTLNLTANATKTTTVNFTINSWVEDQHFPSQSAGTIIGQAQRETPDFPVRYSNGLTAGYIAQSVYGEIYDSGYGFNERPGTQSQFSINQQLPLKGLSLKAVVSYDVAPDALFGNPNGLTRNYTTPITFYTVNKNTTPYTYVAGVQGSSKPKFTETYYQNKSFTYQGILDYKGSFGKNNIGFTGVVESRNVKYQTFTASRINYNLGIDELDYGGPGTTDLTNGGSSSAQKQLGYVYRATYNYGEKYLFEASGRYDGSYLFAPGHRFGFFPAFSAGWVLSEESFLKSIKWLDFLKIRGSYGQSGAYPRVNGTIQTYQYFSGYNLNTNSAVVNGVATQGISEGTQANPDITWERANKFDIGFDATLWNGVLGIEADYFYEKRSNMLQGSTDVLPGEYGTKVALQNTGVMSNHGVDLTIRSSHTFSNGLRLDINGTFTYAINKLLVYNENAATFNNPNRRLIGRQYGIQFGYQALGYFTPDDFVNPNIASPVLKTGMPVPSFGIVRPGDLKYADLSGPNGVPDGKIDANDQTVIGRTQTPGIIYGLEPRVSFKNFDLDVLFQGSANSTIQLSNFFVFPFQMSGSASELSFTEYWKPDRTNTLYPRLSNSPTSNNTQSSSWWTRDDSYIRMKSAELGYTFSNKMLHNTISSLRVFVAGQNIFTWTPHLREILDPENGGSNQNYYQQRVLSIGINAKF